MLSAIIKASGSLVLGGPVALGCGSTGEPRTAARDVDGEPPEMVVAAKGELERRPALAFPRYAMEDLEGTPVTTPGDFPGQATLVFVAFDRWQQAEVDAWRPVVEELRSAHPSLDFVELPVIRRGYVVTRRSIDNAMRGGIPEPYLRQRTWTLYTDRARFLEQLAIDSPEQIVTCLVDGEGRVRFQTFGRPADGETLAALERSVAELVAAPAG